MILWGHNFGIYNQIQFPPYIQNFRTPHCAWVCYLCARENQPSGNWFLFLFNFLFQFNEPENLDQEIKKYFVLAERNSRLRSYLPGLVYDIHSSEMIQKPQETLLGICQFLDLTCDQKYLEACSKRVYNKATKTRYNLVWTETQKELVHRRLQQLPFLKDYRFEDWTIVRL